MHGKESKPNVKLIKFSICQQNRIWGEGELTGPLCKLICSKMSAPFLAFLSFNLREHLVLPTDRQLQGGLNNQSSEKSIFQYVDKNTSISRMIIKSHKEGSDNTVETLTYWSKETLIHTREGKQLDFNMHASKSPCSFIRLLHYHTKSHLCSLPFGSALLQLFSLPLFYFFLSSFSSFVTRPFFLWLLFFHYTFCVPFSLNSFLFSLLLGEIFFLWQRMWSPQQQALYNVLKRYPTKWGCSGT